MSDNDKPVANAAWDLAQKVRHDLDRKSCPDAYMRIAFESIEKHYPRPQHSGMVSVPVDCGCGDSYPAQSYGAGFIHAVGNCPNCEAAKSAAQEQQHDV
jgi:hypothetical protein